MKSIKLHIIIIKILLLPFVFACHSRLNEKEFKAWAQSAENGFYKEKVINSCKVSVQLIPKELLKNPAQEEFVNFHVRLQSSSRGNDLRSDLTNKYGAKVKRYFAFSIENDIRLLKGDKVLKPAFCHFEQGTDLAKDFRLVIAFDTQTDKDMTLVIDPKFINSGKLKFKFNKNNFSNKPSLTTNASLQEDKSIIKS